MTQERFKIQAAVALILRKDQKISLIRRCNTGWCDEFYASAGGGIEENESATQALIREAYEELGITLKKEHLKVVHVRYSRYPQDGETCVCIFMEATEWEGEPRNCESHKCGEVLWADIDALPNNLMPSFKKVVELIKQNVFYSESGWD